MSAVRERGGPRAPLGRVLALVFAVAVTSSVTAMSTSPSVTAATAVSADIKVLAAPSDSGIVRAGQSLTVRVTLSNAGSRASGPLTLQLRLDDARAASREELSAWFGETENPRTPALDNQLVAAQASLGALESGASAVLDLTVAAGTARWGGSFGARLAEVVVADGGNWLAIDRTAVVYVPDSGVPGTVPTTFVQPLSTPGEITGLLSGESLATATREAGALSRALSASAGRPVLLAVDPRVVASIRALGTAAPESALDFLNRLRAAPNETFLLPWADADPSASITASGVALPDPEGTGLPQESGMTEVATTSPAPSDDTDGSSDVDGSVTQAVADMIDIIPTLEGVRWPGAEGFSNAVLEAFAADGSRVVLTPSSVLESHDAVQSFEGTVLLRTDDVLATAAQAAVGAPSQQQFDRAIATISALLASSTVTTPGAPAIIALDRDTPRGADRLLETIAETISLPWVSAGTASAALALSAVDATIVASPLSEARQAAVTAALEAEAADRQFAQIAVTPTVITDTRRLELLAALSLGWGDDSVDALRGFIAASQALRASVSVVESSAILLLTDRATLPVTVQNDLTVPVRVYVRVEPDTTQLRVLDSAVEATVEPQSQARALVPVESLTNGEIDITVTVRDAQGSVLSAPTRVSLNLQAGWETAGTIIVAIGVALLFIVGIVRDLRKRTRRTSGAAERAPKPTPEGTP